MKSTLNTLFLLTLLFSSSLKGPAPTHSQSQPAREIASTLSDCTSLIKNYFTSALNKEFYANLHDELHTHLKPEDKIKDFIYSNFLIHPFYSKHIGKYTSDEAVLEYVNESHFKKPRSENFLRRVDGLNAALKALPNVETTVYSGRALDHETLKLHNQFEQIEFSFHYFLSCSADISVALGFIDRSNALRYNRKPYLYKIHTKNGKVISDLSNFDEQEVLFPTSSTFKVKDKTVKVAKEILPNFLAQDSEFMGQKINILELVEVTPGIVDFDFLNTFKADSIRPFDTKIELKRFIDKDDLSRSPIIKEDTNDEANDDFMDHYGLEASESWLKAAHFIRDNFKHDVLNIEFLKKIHFRAMPSDAYYASFERRRIFSDYKNNKITLDEAIKWLDRIKNRTTTYSGINHKDLAGHFRRASVDYLVFEGEHKTFLGKRYFKADEVEGMLANPAFKREGPIKKIGTNQFVARFHLISPEHIEENINNLFVAARDALRQSQTDKEYIKNVVILEKMLIAIHPFLDGNGRTIRLLSDALYLKRKLPLPLHPRKDDFYKPTADLIEETFSLMQDYSNAYRK